MTLEAFRPFAAPVSLSTQRIQVLMTRVQKQDAILTWGSPGTIVSPTKDNAVKISTGENFKVNPTDSDWVEVGRKVQPVKVVDPNNSANYVVTAQTVAITYGQSAIGQPGGPATGFNYATWSDDGTGPVFNPSGGQQSNMPPGFLSGPNAGSFAPVTPTAPSEQNSTLNPNVATQLAAQFNPAILDSAPAGPIGGVLDVSNLVGQGASTP